MPLGLGQLITASDISGNVAVEKSGGRVSYANTKSLFLDGTGDTFSPGFTAAQKETFFQDDFTISFWGNFNMNNNNWYAFGFDSTHGGATSLTVRMLNLGGGNSWYVTGKFNNISWQTGFLATGLTGDKTTWVHIAMTVEKGANPSDGNTFKMYQNGSLLNSGGTTATIAGNMAATTFQTDVDLSFGALTNASGSTTHGDMKVDEVAFFDSALDANNVAAIYNSGSTFDLRSANGNYKKQANLVRYYRLEDNLTDTQGVTDGSTQGDPTFDSNTPDS
jgi:hypothetical protein|tara:strand:+ start:234 stop:1064 length:831 start_codon:yes stop_codon:yes gene_type:complete